MTSRRKLAGVLASSVVLLMVLVVAGRGAADDDADADPDDLLAAIEMLEPKALELWPDSFAGVWLGDVVSVTLSSLRLQRMLTRR